MTKFPYLLLAALLTAPAFATPPTDASVKELLTVIESQKLMDNSMAQIDAMMQSAMQQALNGKKPTPEVQAVIDDMRAETISMLSTEMRWEVLEPAFVDIYRQSFTQEEVDGMLAFYKSAAGRAVTAKMPLVMQHTMQMVNGLMLGFLPKMKLIQEKALARLKALGEK